MKTAMIALYEVFPPISGAASVSYHLARYLPGQVVLLQMTHKGARPALRPEIRTVEFPYASDRHWLKLFSVLRRLPDIARVLRSERPDVVVIEGASWAVYLVFVLATLRFAGVHSPVVYHSHNVEYLLRKARNGTFITLLTRWAERALFRRSSLATAVSSGDARAIAELYGVAPALVPNGVAPDRFDVSLDEAARTAARYGITDRTVLFMGLPDYPPNTEAIEALILRIFPAVLRSAPGLRLAIIGGRVPFEREWLLNPGSIPHTDVPAFVKACAIGVAPIRSGSGTRVKLLEYMAAGRPVVSTTKGAEGLGAIPGRHLLIADSEEAFADGIARLAGDPVLSEAIGREARHFVRERFSWNALAGGLAIRIRGLLEGRPADPPGPGSPESFIPHE